MISVYIPMGTIFDENVGKVVLQMDMPAFVLAACLSLGFGLIALRFLVRVRPKGYEMMEQARRDNTHAIGTLEKKVFMRGDVSDSRLANRKNQWAAIYRYEVGGKTYHYRELVTEEPRESVTIFYCRGNPGCGFTSTSYQNVRGGQYTGVVLGMLVLCGVLYWAISLFC